VGKTASALSTFYLIQARRILDVIPAAEVHHPMVHQCSTEDVLLRIGAFCGTVDTSVRARVGGLRPLSGAQRQPGGRGHVR